MLNIKLRLEQEHDIEAIFNLTQRAFEHAEHTDHTEQFIVNALRDAHELSISLVATLEDEIIGHVAISPVKISSRDLNWYGLGPISVAPEFQHQGVGKALIQEVLAQLKQLGAKGCVVLGDPKYYSKFGFQLIEGLYYPDVPPEYFQALAFEANDDYPQGAVSYSQAFNAQA